MTREFVTPDQMREICAQAARYPRRYIYIAQEVNKLVEQITAHKGSVSISIGGVEMDGFAEDDKAPLSGSFTVPCSNIRSVLFDKNGALASVHLSPCASAVYKDLPRTDEGKVSLEDLWEAYKNQMSGGITNT
jgi:hypothetical protein